MNITVTPDGVVRFIWDDALAALVDAGVPKIVRASHVEPTPDGRWTADMAPSGGPVLGPFTTRCEALAAEHGWLEQHGF